MTTNHDESSMPAKPKRQQRQMTAWESDDCIVPMKPGNSGGGKAVGPTRESRRTSTTLSGGTSVYQRLDRITLRAEGDPAATFNNVFTLLDQELLFYAFRKLKRDKAPGIDGVTVADYEVNLRNNLRDLENRLHRGGYVPRPSLRREIPKGKGKTRSLGMSCVEDKIVQRAIVMILERIYEVDFVDTSFGFRPDRSPHQALSVLVKTVATRKVNWILDADIAGFFDNLSHSQLLELLGRRIEDPRMLRLIGRLLRAGVTIDGQCYDTSVGAAQGSILSPLLANVYLHYVLDEWFERDVKPRLRGEAYLVR